MNINEIKKIKLADYLQSLGYTPVKQQGKSLWYKSPLRNETDASFKVNTELNQWYDFGIGKCGNIIAALKTGYASIGYERGRNKLVDLRKFLENKRMIISEGKGWRYNPDFVF